MKRYELYDPPEYVAFKPTRAAAERFQATLERSRARASAVRKLPREKLLDLYRGLLRFRLHDIALKRWVRQGVLSKAWLGTGEEAVTIGSVHALRPGDYVGPMIRNAGACHEMGMPISEMFKAYLATADTHTGGRDLHIGDLERGIVAPISHVGALMPVCAGIALAGKLQGKKLVAMTYVGDGATKVGEVHEAMSFAAACRLPLVMVVQMNHIALGTRSPVHSANRYEDLGKAYGVPLFSSDGNNVLDTHAAASEAVAIARSGRGAAILLSETFRMGGHATHDEAESRKILPARMFEQWGKRDPVGVYEHWLVTRKKATEADLASVEAEVLAEIESAEREALASRGRHVPDPATQTDAVFAS
ncbi:MAG: thiamine pyrophosphate-dependent dehydrogenase E1 component subunit alpha [Acidobacteriota bacterium]